MMPVCKFLSVASLAATILFGPGPSLAGQPQTGERAERIIGQTPEIRALESAVAARPDDYASRAALAKLLGQAGRYEEALAQYDFLIQTFPDDVDHSLARAYVLSWLGRDQEALKGLERARVLAPDYQDVWQLEIRVLERQKDVASKTTAEALRLEAETRFPDSEWHRSVEVAKEIRWKMTLGAGYERLTGDNPDWNNQFLQLDWVRSGDQRYFGRVARDVRFDNTDQQLVAG
ncbi:MAG: tetratricopeptide repeat protein, partial [Gammaproteobacteria bacterium]|nr:tetratricopeptide repeat protein [Gammaproteobacteria bacterium]